MRTALPDLQSIRTVERPEDRHRYLVLDYDTGLQAPSWLVSDGTLRLLALTILAYLPGLEGAYLIEEPENGIHPRAVETVLQSLSSVYGAQVLLATHSPVILSLARPEQVLCFNRTAQGATDIVLGSEHPRLRQWRGETDLGTLFARGTDTPGYQREIYVCYVDFPCEFLPMTGQTAQFPRIWGEFSQVIGVSHAAGQFFP